MEERNFFERLVELSPGMEIWWDSSPVVFENWCKKMLEKAEPAEREILQRQFGRMYSQDSPQSQLQGSRKTLLDQIRYRLRADA